MHRKIMKSKDSRLMITYTRTFITPLNPKTEQINIKDIAHALSMICRANGHFDYFYSVAQHSINCALEAKSRNLSKKVQLACLLHDGSEAYIADIIRPVKEELHDYLKIEEKLQNCVFDRFSINSLDIVDNQAVKQIDNDVLYHEFLNICNEKIFENEPLLYGKLDFTEKPYRVIEADFIELYNAIAL